MANAAKKAPATLEDLLAIPENERFHEIIDGELVRKAMPSFGHGSSQIYLGGRLTGPYGRRSGGGSDGPGGWRFASEVEILFGAEVFRPDIAGWRRERMPTVPKEFPVTLRPDWVCEVLSPSNKSNDTVKKMRTYHRFEVPHYWLLDPIAEELTVYRWTSEGYLVAQAAEGAEQIRAEPFGEVVFSVRELIGDDE